MVLLGDSTHEHGKEEQKNNHGEREEIDVHMEATSQEKKGREKEHINNIHIYIYINLHHFFDYK